MPSTTALLSNTAAAVALVSIASGTNALLRPRSALHMFGFSIPPRVGPEVEKLVDNLMRLYGARNLALGILQAVNWYFDQRRALAFTLLAGTVVAVVDGVVARLQVGGKAMPHWACVPVLWGVAWELLSAEQS